MPDFPPPLPALWSPGLVIGPWSAWSILPSVISSAGASAVWPTANRALYYPFRLPVPVLVDRLWVSNGAAVSGNFDIGIFAEDGKKLVSTGSTAQAGTSAIQVVDVTNTVIGPGIFYVGLIVSNTTGAVIRVAPAQLAFLQALGMAQMDTAIPLGDATFATLVPVYVPDCGLSGRSFV